MISAVLMWRRLVKVIRQAAREEDFVPVFGAAVFLVVLGTITYSFGNDWNVVDSFYFAVATLTTTSVSDPDLVLQEGWMKVFSAFYILIGIGILVEVLRRLGLAFVEVRRGERHGAGDGG